MLIADVAAAQRRCYGWPMTDLDKAKQRMLNMVAPETRVKARAILDKTIAMAIAEATTVAMDKLDKLESRVKQLEKKQIQSNGLGRR